jgi:hypothetical protein
MGKALIETRNIYTVFIEVPGTQAKGRDNVYNE